MPFDTQSPFITSGIRLGSPAMTTRGFGPEDMRQVAKAIDLALSYGEAKLQQAAAIVKELCAAHPLYPELD